jgi:release factor glutamine methyltransferase
MRCGEGADDVSPKSFGQCRGHTPIPNPSPIEGEGSNPSIRWTNGVNTLVQAWTGARARLQAAGIDSPAIDARLLVEAAAGATRADILADPHRRLSAEQAAALDGFLARRERREPVSQILGRKGFWKIMLNVSADVLTPRPDTETLVERVLRDFPPGRGFSLLDLGVGSGAILLAILAERPAAKGLGVDVSEEALAVARENAANLGLAGRVALLRGDWTRGLGDAGFDLVVANPPYIPSEDIAALEPEVRDHEPRLALDGGPDGLSAYRLLAPEILRVLKPGGRFAVEIGFDQARAVEALFIAAGAAEVETIQDLALRDRVVLGQRPI